MTRRTLANIATALLTAIAIAACAGAVAMFDGIHTAG